MITENSHFHIKNQDSLTMRHYIRKMNIQYNRAYYSKYVIKKTYTSFTPKFMYSMLKNIIPHMRSDYFQYLYKPALDWGLSYRSFLFILYLYTIKDINRGIYTYRFIQDSFFNPNNKTTRSAINMCIRQRKMGFITIDKTKSNGTKASKRTKGRPEVEIKLTDKALNMIFELHRGQMHQLEIIENVAGSPINFTDYSTVLDHPNTSQYP